MPAAKRRLIGVRTSRRRRVKRGLVMPYWLSASACSRSHGAWRGCEDVLVGQPLRLGSRPAREKNRRTPGTEGPVSLKIQLWIAGELPLATSTTSRGKGLSRYRQGWGGR